MRYIGYYGTAVEAAVAYAKHAAEDGLEAEEKEDEWADGYKLSLSTTNTTGYMGVHKRKWQVRSAANG